MPRRDGGRRPAPAGSGGPPRDRCRPRAILAPRATRRARYGLAALALAGALALGGCSAESNLPQPDAAARRATVPVIVAPVQLKRQRTRLEAVGTSVAQRSVTVYPAAAGEVTAVRFGAGQRVGEGEVLLELDRRDQALAVKLATVRLEDARRLLGRYQRSEASGAVTLATLDDARSAVDRARIELDRARIALEERTVSAPFAGVVGITDVEVGDRIGPETAVTTLDDRSALLVSFEAPESFIGRLRVGAAVAVVPWNDPGSALAGRILDLASRIDPATRTFVVRARVDNPDDRLRPGMSFRVTLTLEGPSYPVVPEIALQWGGDGAYVWSVRERRAQRVAVRIVQRDAGEVLVEAALGAGVPVVVEGVQRMREGLEVSYRAAVD